MLKMKFSKWTTIISCHVKNIHPCMHSVIAHTQHILFSLTCAIWLMILVADWKLNW